MDDEKLQKTMEFILNNQAQFTVDIQKMQEEQKEAVKRIGTLERVSLNLYNSTVEQSKQIAEISAEIRELRLSQKETDERFKKTDERFKETDERLNALILIAEKFLSGDDEKRKRK